MYPQYLLRKLYDVSPAFLRRTVGVLGCVPATVRYGPPFARIWRLLHESDRWDEERLAQFRLEELRTLLTYAGERVPYYRRLFRRIGLRPASIQSLDELTQLPLLTRDMVRELGCELLAEGVRRRSYKVSTTAGTSGKPLGFCVTYDASAAEWAFMLRNWEYAGFKPGNKRAVLRGGLIRGRRNGRLWEYDPVNQALHFSSFDLNEANLARYVKKMHDYRPEFLHAYPSSATLLAQYLQQTGERLPGLRGVLIGSENVYPVQREFLASVFGCRVFSWYGHSEKCILAGECGGSSQYHIVPEYGIVELVDGVGQPVRLPGQRGQLVGTGFINRATVFIRYLTDDEAEWSPEPCSCGRISPRIRSVRGRWHQEMLVGRSGALDFHDGDQPPHERVYAYAPVSVPPGYSGRGDVAHRQDAGLYGCRRKGDPGRVDAEVCKGDQAAHRISSANSHHSFGEV